MRLARWVSGKREHPLERSQKFSEADQYYEYSPSEGFPLVVSDVRVGLATSATRAELIVSRSVSPVHSFMSLY